jgi:hypothetical protein
MRTTKTTKQATPVREQPEVEKASDLRIASYREAGTRKTFDHSIETVLQGLERIADDIRRARTRYSEETAVKIAYEIQHSVLWGVANLSLDSLAREAAEADEAARDRADAQKAVEALNVTPNPIATPPDTTTTDAPSAAEAK